jgi:hypothetical protein
LGVAGIVLTALHPAYSAARPKRLLGLHAADGDKGALLLSSYGADGMRPLAESFPDAVPVPASWPTSLALFTPPFSHMLPAPPPAIAAPHAEVTTSGVVPEFSRGWCQSFPERQTKGARGHR